MSFFHDVIAKLITADESFSGHTSFKIVDPTAVGENPIREVSLDAVPLDSENSILTLSWAGSAEKILEKKGSPEEINHMFQLISTDMSQIVSLSNEEKYEDAKNAMKEVMKTYASDTDAPVATNMPKLHNTQASVNKQAEDWKVTYYNKNDSVISSHTITDRTEHEAFKEAEGDMPSGCEDWSMMPIKSKKADEDSNIWKQAKVTMQNLWFSTPDELIEYQEKMKSGQKSNQDSIPLWEQEGKKNPQDKGNLAPPSLSYEDVEKNKEKDIKNLDKRIHEQVKTELESALEEKKATMFTDNDKKLVDGMRAVGRNWDEIKKYMVKELAYDKESVDMYIDDMRSHEDGIEPVEEINPLTPPSDLVSPETHDKLLKDLEDKKEEKLPVEKEIEEKVEEKPIKEESAKKCSEHVHEWTRSKPTATVDTCYCGRFRHNENNKNPIIEEVTESSFTPQDIMAISELDEIARADNDEIRKVALRFWKSAPNYLGDDFSDYYVGPGIGYDPSALEKSNFRVALQMLGGEGNGVVVASFGGFGGGSEVIFVHKDAKDKVAILQGIEEQMASYPVLDEDDLSQQEWLDYEASYKNWAKDNALDIIEEHLRETNPELKESIKDIALTPEIEAALERSVIDTLAYNNGESVIPKELLANESIGEVINYFRSKLGMEIDQKFVPENPDQLKLFESAFKARVIKKALQKKADDTNPLQEPIKEDPTMATGQDVLPMGKPEKDHNAPTAGDWVMVKSDLKDELPAFKAKFVSEYASNDGTQYATVETEAQDLLEVEMYRVTKITDAKPAAQETEPISEPQIEKPTEVNMSVTPSTEKLTSMSSKSTKCVKCDKSLPVSDMKENVHGAGYLCKEDATEWNKDASQEAFLSLKAELDSLLLVVKEADIEGSDFEKGISQNKTSELSYYKVTFEDGNTLETGLNGTLEDAQKYYVGNYFQFGDTDEHPKDKMVKALSVEKIASQVKTSDNKCEKCEDPLKEGEGPRCAHCSKAKSFVPPLTDSDLNKTADPIPGVDPKTQLKDYKITPKFVQKDQAVPATEEMDAVLSKMDELENKLSILDAAKKDIQAKMKAEMAKIDQSGERVQMEEELQAAVEKAGILIEATESKIVSWRDKLLTLQNEEVQLVPQLTQKELLEKIYKKFDKAEAFVTSVLNGMLSLAKSVNVRTLVRWPQKKSSVTKEASALDEVNQMNDELLSALKELSSSL